MTFELATTRDPQLLVPGSLEALHADADDLDARAATLSGAAADVGRHVVASWIGDAASGWAARREVLADGLVGVADVLAFAASVLRAHADVLAWGRERAAVAADMWENVPGLSATGGLVHYGRDRSGQPGMLSPHQVFGSHLGDPFGLRAMAEAVLADARREVAASEEAAAQVFDSLSEGMPDGRWDPSQFVFRLGQWVLARAATLPVVLATRAIVDHDGLVAEGEAANEALGALGEMAVHNPEQVVPTLLDTQTLEDNPGAWWGGMAPDLALAATGAGTARLAGLRQLSLPTVTATPAPRVFVSRDPLVADVARVLEAERPGWVRALNHDIPYADGSDMREIDIDLGDTVVQVKSGDARRIIRQMEATIATTGRTVVGYAPTMRPGAWVEAAQRGLPIARTPDELIAILKELE